VCDDDDELQILDGPGPSQRIDEASSVNEGNFIFHNTCHLVKSNNCMLTCFNKF
jgi:hypothetical protein